MKTSNRKYWEAIALEMEETVSSEFDNEIYNENHIPDLESLASTCPFEDLRERLSNWAIAITCRLETSIGYERYTEEDNKGNFNLCIQLYGDSELA